VCTALYDVYQTLVAVCDVAAKMVITQGRLSVRCSNRSDSDIKPQLLVTQGTTLSMLGRDIISEGVSSFKALAKSIPIDYCV
jgi:hypothetical protein